MVRLYLWRGGLVVALALLVVPFAASAFDARKGSTVYVAKGETIDGNLYAAGTTVVVDGTVRGDVFCAGTAVTINGHVDGDVFCAASSISINGTVGGSLRTAGSTVTANGVIERSVMAVGSTIALNQSARVGWNVLAAGASMTADAPVGGDIQFAGATLVINNTVGSDVAFYAEGQNRQGQGKPSLFISPQAVIKGNLKYSETIDAQIQEGSQIKGTVTKTPARLQKGGAQKDAGAYVLFQIFGIISSIVIGLVLVIFGGKHLRAIMGELLERPGYSLGRGVAAFVLIPFSVIILLVTVIGIPLAIILGLSYIIALMLAKVIVGITIGQWVADYFKADTSLYWNMIGGIVISSLVFAIPFFGWILGLVALWWALGGMYQHMQETRR